MGKNSCRIKKNGANTDIKSKQDNRFLCFKKNLISKAFFRYLKKRTRRQCHNKQQVFKSIEFFLNDRSCKTRW